MHRKLLMMKRMDGNQECPETVWTEHISHFRNQMYQKVGKRSPLPQRNCISFLTLEQSRAYLTNSVIG